LYGILCWAPAVSFITRTSLWRHLSILNAATLPFKGSHNEQYSVIRFPWAKALNCVQCIVTSVLRNQQYTLGVISLLIVKKVSSIRNDLAQCCFDGGQVILYRQLSWLWANFLDQNVHCWSCKTLFTIHWSHLRVNDICAKSFCPR